MKTIVLVLALVIVGLGACQSKPTNSSYHNSSNDVRQNNKNVNVNSNVNTNIANR